MRPLMTFRSICLDADGHITDIQEGIGPNWTRRKIKKLGRCAQWDGGKAVVQSWRNGHQEPPLPPHKPW